MKITRTSKVSGVTRTRDIDVTEEQLKKWEEGTNAQTAFQGLSAADREFIMTGTTDDEWDEIFKNDEEFTYVTGYDQFIFEKFGDRVELSEEQQARFDRFIEKLREKIKKVHGDLVDEHNYKINVINGQKYIKINLGGSGFLMYGVEDDCLYGIKSYNAIDKKKNYGNLVDILKDGFEFDGYSIRTKARPQGYYDR